MDIIFITKLLKTLNYNGDCSQIENLRWALRVGALSFQYQELLSWLDQKLQQYEPEATITRDLLDQLLQSKLKMWSKDGVDPILFRYTTIAIILLLLGNAVRAEEGKELAESVRPAKTLSHFWRKCTDVPGHLILFIVDRHSPEGFIDKMHWLNFLHALDVKLLQLVNAPNIHYEVLRSEGSLYRIACSNAEAALWLLAAIVLLPKLWRNEKIAAYPSDCAAKFMVSTAWVYIRRPYSIAGNILSIIANQNAIDTSNWRLVKSGPEDRKGQHFLLEVDSNSKAVIKATNCRLNFALSGINLIINKDHGKWYDVKKLQKI